MSPRNVLVVVPHLGAGGAERHATWIATALDPARWTPHVLAFGDGPLRRDLDRAGVPVEIRELPGGVRRLSAAAQAIREVAGAVRADAISGHDVLVEVAVRLAFRGRTPVPFLSWKHTYGHVGYRGLREKLFERATGGAVTRYGAVCHTQVRYLTDELGLPADKITVVPNSVPVPPDLPPPPRSGPPTVLMPAAMRRDKDHHLVLEAWPAVLRRHPKARLLLAGDGPCRAELEVLARGLPGVEFLGVRSDIAYLLELSHLLVLASYRVECFPYAVLEAMAAARGVVSTATGGLPELVDDGVTGKLVPPHDGKALAAALVAGLDDATARQPRWGASGWLRGRRVFPLDRWAERTADLLDDVAGVPHPAAAPAPIRP